MNVHRLLARYAKRLRTTDARRFAHERPLQLESLEQRDLMATMVLKNISPRGNSSPSDFTKLGDAIYFTANDGEHGIELWKTDGTREGTMLVSDLLPGPSSGRPQDLTVLDDLLYFTADDGEHGRELYVSDGTYEGTVIVRDIHRGNAASAPSDLTALNHRLYFTAYEPDHGREVWLSDGTTAGTMLMDDLRPGGASALPTFLTPLNDALYFSATGPDSIGRELWAYRTNDDTVELVKNIADVYSQSSDPRNLLAVDDRLYFSAEASTDLTVGRELYVSDGTADGTGLLKDINTGRDDSNPTFLADDGHTFYFQATTDSKGDELWKSDGTAAGTVQVIDFAPGISSSRPSSVVIDDDGVFVLYEEFNDLVFVPYQGAKTIVDDRLLAGSTLTASDGVVYFVRRTVAEDYELWKVNRATLTKKLVRDIYPGVRGAYPEHAAFLDDRLYFSADDGTNGDELWVSEDNPEPELVGLPAGTIPEGTRVDLTANALWPGAGGPYDIRWYVYDSPDLDTIPIDSERGAAFSFTPNNEGEYTIRVTLTDARGLTSEQQATLIVTNAAPHVEISGTDVNGVWSVPVQLGTSVDDAGSRDTFRFQWNVARDNRQVASSEFDTLEFTPLEVGDYEVTLLVTDDGGAATILHQVLKVVYSKSQETVRELYQLILKRLPNFPGLTYWSAKMDGGMSRIAVANALLGSMEYRRGRVKAIYQQLLRRAPTPAELDHWASDPNRKNRDWELTTALVTSDEYLRRYASADDLVEGLFQDVLRRQANPDGLTFWSNKLDGSRSAKVLVARGIVASRESVWRQVMDIYQRFGLTASDVSNPRQLAAAISAGSLTLESIAQEVVEAIVG